MFDINVDCKNGNEKGWWEWILVIKNEREQHFPIWYGLCGFDFRQMMFTWEDYKRARFWNLLIIWIGKIFMVNERSIEEKWRSI